LNRIIWIFAISSIFLVVFLHHPLQQFENNTTTNLQNALYIAFYRNVFALALAWIIFGCENGTGSIINWLLSRPVLQPIGRMGLSMYLIHVVLHVVLVGAQKQPYYFEDVFTIYAFWGDFMTTAILSTLLFLTAEAPFVLAEKYFHSLWSERRKTVGK
jgi:peptidoglycan/LPS O-acetylase OafA/YrhL